MQNKRPFVSNPDFRDPKMSFEQWMQNNRAEKLAIAQAKEYERLFKRDWIDDALDMADNIRNLCRKVFKSRGSR